MKQHITKIVFIWVFFSFIGCITYTIPIPTTTPKSTEKNPPSNNPPQPTTSDNTTNKNPKKPNNNILSDPDNLKITFKKEASESYINSFKGKVREQAKTTPSDAATRYFESVGAVLKTLPTDNYMRRIGVNNTSPRTEDENINVFIRKAYIFYISEEEDGDFHLIIGDLINGNKKNLITAEVSGLPANKNTRAYFLLERTRRQLYEQFPEFFISNKKTFKPRNNFPEIAIRGSLFFDTHHSSGQIGSGAEKPTTVWEIHPVTYLNFIIKDN